MAEEKTERQGGARAGGGCSRDQLPAGADSVAHPSVELPSWRDLDAPPALPSLMNRKRTVEKRDQEKTIRFTRTAVGVISAAAHQRGQKFAGFVGDAALSVAQGKAGW